MITLTRLDGTRFGVNDDQIERVDSTPTTVVTLVNGNRYMVQETIDEIVTAIVDFRAAALSRATPAYRGRAIPADRRIADAEEAAERRLSRRRKRKVSVVAVEAAPSAEGARWASKVLDALEPTMTWATVEAMRKAEDIAAWCAEVGVVDALEVTGVNETVTPAAVLLAGVPVGRIDGRPATAATWVGVLAREVAA